MYNKYTDRAIFACARPHDNNDNNILYYNNTHNGDGGGGGRCW